MEKFIIFLDIDGVFNSELFFKDRHKKQLRKSVKKKEITSEEYYDSMLDKEAIKLFNGLIEKLKSKYEVQVVISSTWRHNKDLQNILSNSGAEFKIHDITPISESRIRGVEIHEWLKDNINPENQGCHYFDFYKYAIIDDDSDMLLNQANHFFRTDNYVGFNPNTYHRIKRFALHETF